MPVHWPAAQVGYSGAALPRVEQTHVGGRQGWRTAVATANGGSRPGGMQESNMHTKCAACAIVHSDR